MKYDTFINSSFLLQNRADEFTRKRPAERKQVLADILDLDDYRRLEERAHEQAKALLAQIKGIDAFIEQLQGIAQDLHVHEQLMQAAERQVQALDAQLQLTRTDVQQAQQAVRLLQADAQRRRELLEEGATLTAKRQQQTQEMETCRAKIALDEATVARHDEIVAGMALLKSAQQELKELEAQRPQYEDLQEQLRQQAQILRDEARKLTNELTQAQREAEQLISQIAQRPEREAELERLRERLAAREHINETLQQLYQQRDALEEQLSQANGLRFQQQELQAQIRQRLDSLVANREEQKRTLNRLARSLKQLPRLQQDLATAQTQQQEQDRLTPELAQLRERDQTLATSIGELRAHCQQFHEMANDIKQRRDMLLTNPTTECPLCRNDLGEHGNATIAQHYQEEIERLRVAYREHKQQADRHETEQRKVQQQITASEQQLEQAQRGAARLESLQTQLADLEQLQQEQQTAQASHDDTVRQIDTGDYEPEARANLATVEAQLIALGLDLRAADPLHGLTQQRQQLRRTQQQYETQLAAYSGLEGQIATQQHTLQQIEAAAAALPTVETTITHLQTVLEQEDFGHAVRSTCADLRTTLQALPYQPETYAQVQQRMEELTHWDTQERELQLAQERLQQQQRMLHLYESTIHDLDQRIERVNQEEAELATRLKQLVPAQQQLEALECTLTEQQREQHNALQDFHDKRSLRDRARDAGEQLVQKQSQRQSLLEEQSLLSELAEACGKKGVQAMLIDLAIPEIEREANQLLSRMTGNQMHISLDTQRSTKRGDTVETLDIRIADGLGTRDYDAFSGGESMRINFALRVALSRMLARRAGANLETLVIDEGFGALDADGRERFVDAITSVQHDFKRILVVTHLDDLKDRFPARIEIKKTPAGSQWELL
ncbi:MAG: SMC family ATPase [Chloroflexaceae bacterium]|nr:SMC family ATPase [Chloroflexaceae bacterium]